jgi:hypothetical protein
VPHADGCKLISPAVKLCRDNAERLSDHEAPSPAIAQESGIGIVRAERAKLAKAPWCNSLDLLAQPIPEIEYLLHGIIPTEAVILLSGREGSLKTWLALGWAYAIAERKQWLERITQSVPVLFVNAEMSTNLFRLRVQAVGGSKNLNIWGWQSEEFPTCLDNPRLKEAARVHKLIILDTLKRFMPGLDENSSTDMAVITGGLRKLTRDGATVLALHHAPKDPVKLGYRGSTELGAGVDIALTLERVERNGMDLLQLTAPKTRYPEDPRMTLKVVKTPARPIFENATGEAGTQAINALEVKLEELEGIIKNLTEQEGRKPNQSDIIRIAQSQGIATGNTVQRLLNQGEGKHWRSNPQGRSRVYELLPNCPAP